MSTVVHKYMPQEMTEEERVATFAARHETLERLTTILREQRQTETLNNILLTGGRGAGKTTLVLMLERRIESDDELRRAWMPVRFSEELPAVTSLRDLMAATLSALAERGQPIAAEWLQKADAEADEAQSLEIAITGLRQIVRRSQRRFVLFVENLDAVFERALSEQEEAHLRRLLMTEPFLMIVGTAVRLFPEVTDYAKPFFNFFQEVRLERLNDEQVEELLLRRADYHHNELLRKNLSGNRPSVRAISRLTGGNPRLVVMLYEVLRKREIESVVTVLRELIDELTPLLKDVVDQLPPQQGKVLDAVMRRGGTASPHELVEPTRLSLNTVTTQLTRLRDAHLVEVHGGGKGRKAVYVVPDQLFCTWYQLRYLRPNRRRIELVVEFLRIFFTEEERYTRLQGSQLRVEEAGPGATVDAEYLAASLAGTSYETAGRELVVTKLLQSRNFREAALALTALEPSGVEAEGAIQDEAKALMRLGHVLEKQANHENAIEAYRQALRADPTNMDARLALGRALAGQGDHARAIDLFSEIIESANASPTLRATALGPRGVTKGQLGDHRGAADDFSAVIELPGAPAEQVANALLNRGVTKGQLGDSQGEIEDYSAVIEFPGAPVKQVANALLNRGVAKELLGDIKGAIDDYSALVALSGAPAEQVVRARLSRGRARLRMGDRAGSFADLQSAADQADNVDQTRALFVKFTAGNWLALLDGAESEPVFTLVAKIARSIADVRLRRETILAALHRIAGHGRKDTWLALWEALEAAGAEDAEFTDLFRPAYQALKSGDRNALGALPVDQRELVRAVLERFDQR